MAITALSLAPALVLARAQRSRPVGATAPIPTVG